MPMPIRSTLLKRAFGVGLLSVGVWLAAAPATAAAAAPAMKWQQTLSSGTPAAHPSPYAAPATPAAPAVSASPAGQTGQGGQGGQGSPAARAATDPASMAAASREAGPSNLPGSPILSGSPSNPCPQDADAAAGRMAAADKPAAVSAPVSAYVRPIGSARHRWQQTLDRPEPRKAPGTALPQPSTLPAARSTAPGAALGAASGRRNCL